MSRTLTYWPNEADSESVDAGWSVSGGLKKQRGVENNGVSLL